MTTQSAAVNWSQYLALRSMFGFVQCFDVDQNLKTAATVASLFHWLSRTRRRRAEANIARCFPEWTEQRVQDVAVESTRHMLQLFLVELLVTPRLIGPTTWTRYVRLDRMQHLLDLLVRGEPAIFVTGHCGNWELLGAATAAIGYPLVALARPLDNPLINRWLLRIREARGTRVITKWGATPILQDTLCNGGHIAFIADQNAGDQGLFVPFFGRLASSYKSIGLLAMRYNVPIVAGCALRLGQRFRYELSCNDIIRPQDWVDQPDPLFYITARFNRAIEQMVRKSPEQYLWLHRRWKSRPRHEREGQHIPSKLVAKLERLPWMNPAELARIIESSNQEAARRRAGITDPD